MPQARRHLPHLQAPLGVFALFSALTSPGFAQDVQPVLLGTVPGRPTTIEFAPGVDDQVYVAEKTGRIFRFRDGAYVPTPVLDLRNVVDDNGEGGLVGFAFDPEFETNGHFYVAMNVPSTTGTGDSMISRFSMMPGSVNLADPASEVIIWGPILQTTPGHKGGDLEFGPDGLLYHSLGDGDAGSALNSDAAMDLANPRGKILRFDVRAPYPHVPANNPFVGSMTENEHIFVSGLRNPFRMEVDSVTGDVFVGDVGAGRWEELTRIHPDTQAGEGLGWPCVEAFGCRGFPDPACDCANPGTIDPFIVLSHSAPDDACAIMGGVVIRGGVVPSLEGSFIFTDFCSGRYYRVDDPSGAGTLVEISDVIKRPDGASIRFVVDFAQGNDGRVYFTNHYGGEIWVLDPVGGFDTYCVSGPNSTGQEATIEATGSPSISEADLSLRVTGLPPNSTGLFMMSQSTGFVPMFGSSLGTLCLGAPIYRWIVGGAASSNGEVMYSSDLLDLPQDLTFQAGETWYFQYWHRDFNPIPTSSTSNGASVLFVP
ncbi:MAG: PQQ-dependent sugar dehydrogenase [Planctomycetota bacterium]